MAHFAEIDKNNKVIRVLCINNLKPNEGYDWLVDRLGGTWIKTSYNTFGGEHKLGGTPLRKNFAGVGFTYDPDRDAFIPPSPYPSWILEEESCQWKPPTPYPSGNKAYEWDEESVSWVEVTEE